MDGSKQGKDKTNFARGVFSAKNLISGLENIFQFKNKQPIFLILIIGIAFMMIPKTFDSSPSADLSEESRLCRILSDIEGAGKVTVMITYYESERNKDDIKQAKGAVITSDGAGDISVKNALSEAVQAALDLPAHKVRVYKSGGK